MIFSRRIFTALESYGVLPRLLFLPSTRSPLRLLAQAIQVAGEVRSFRPEAVHADFGGRTALLGALCSRSPLVITYRGSDLNPCPNMGRLTRVFYHAMSQVSALRAEAIVCVSAQLKARLWWRRERVTVIPSGVDISTFVPMLRSEARRRLRFGIHEEIVLFNGGGPRAIKRPDLAMAAVEYANRTRSGIRLVVLDGTVDPCDVPLYLNAADCLLVTSEWEGSPTIVNEAMACNLPVVSVNVGDVAMQLAEVTPTEIVPRCPECLGDAIVKILSEGLRSNGRVKAQRISTMALAEQINAIYSNILTADRVPKKVPSD
jgi:glycosyltransferase involved in cell wall biosynthesis